MNHYTVIKIVVEGQQQGGRALPPLFPKKRGRGPLKKREAISKPLKLREVSKPSPCQRKGKDLSTTQRMRVQDSPSSGRGKRGREERGGSIFLPRPGKGRA